MPKLKTTLGKAEHAALDAALQSLYIADGDNFKLDADFEDVTGLKAKRDELLGKLTDQQKLLKSFEGVDPEAAKAALAKLNEIEDGQLVKKQQFDELFAKKKGEWETEKESLAKKISAMIAKQAESDLQMKLVAAGVKGEKAEDLAIILKHKHIQAVEDGGNVVWKTLDGLETVDLATYIPGLKETKGDYFQATMPQGSGAQGSQSQGSGIAKTATKDQLKAMSQEQKREFYTNGGEQIG